jgi:hypothetical protein
VACKDTERWLSGRLIVPDWDMAELGAQKEEIARDDKSKFQMVV